MKVKELLSKVENIGYILKEENGNEIDFEKLTIEDENTLKNQEVISFDIEKDNLVITIQMPKPKEKQTFTPKFNIGQKVYYCSYLISGNCSNKEKIVFRNDSYIKLTTIDGIKFCKTGVRYDVECSYYLVNEDQLFETKEELLQHLNNLINQAVGNLENVEND